MPTVCGFRIAVALEVLALLLRCGGGGVGGVDGDDDDVEVLAGLVADHFERAGQAFELFRAEHRAGVVDEGEDCGLLRRGVGI